MMVTRTVFLATLPVSVTPNDVRMRRSRGELALAGMQRGNGRRPEDEFFAIDLVAVRLAERLRANIDLRAAAEMTTGLFPVWAPAIAACESLEPEGRYLPDPDRRCREQRIRRPRRRTRGADERPTRGHNADPRAFARPHPHRTASRRRKGRRRTTAAAHTAVKITPSRSTPKRASSAVNGKGKPFAPARIARMLRA
jgi:hypothetical protein